MNQRLGELVDGQLDNCLKHAFAKSHGRVQWHDFARWCRSNSEDLDELFSELECALKLDQSNVHGSDGPTTAAQELASATGGACERPSEPYISRPLDFNF